jgi:hypothetical protein
MLRVTEKTIFNTRRELYYTAVWPEPFIDLSTIRQSDRFAEVQKSV